MEKVESDYTSKTGIEGIVEYISGRKYLKYLTLAILVVLYIVINMFVRSCAGSDKFVYIFNNRLPVSTFAGVLTAIGNIPIILMVLFYKKTGFCTAMIMLAFQFPMIIIGMLASRNLMSLPGLFSNMFTIAAVFIIRIGITNVEREKRRLGILFEQTVTSLVSAIDAKDPYTRGHSSRVAEYAKKLAMLSGKSDKECEEIYYAALLHDVGKIGIDEHIISKSGKLTKEEYDSIKLHSEKGAQILKNISAYPYLSIGANYHHERYDGNGYPTGLKGEEIPEIARIISVADAYDAMTSKRSYRDPFTQEKVLEEFVNGIGTQFDPKYAELMIELIKVDSEFNMKEDKE